MSTAAVENMLGPRLSRDYISPKNHNRNANNITHKIRITVNLSHAEIQSFLSMLFMYPYHKKNYLLLLSFCFALPVSYSVRLTSQALAMSSSLFPVLLSTASERKPCPKPEAHSNHLKNYSPQSSVYVLKVHVLVYANVYISSCHTTLYTLLKHI